MDGAGSAYIYENIADVWTQVTKITNSDRSILDQFGYSVSISGDYIVVGANLEDENSMHLNTMHSAGSAYVFRNIAGNWSECNKITPLDRQVNDLFAASVAIDGINIIAGTIMQQYDANGENEIQASGAAYIFKLALRDIKLKKDITYIPFSSDYFMEFVTAGTSSGPVAFTVENMGISNLHLSGNPKIIMDGIDSPFFTLDQTLLESDIEPLASSDFTITFNPDSARNYAVQISITNDDEFENPFYFILYGIGGKIPQTINDFDNITVKTYGDEPFLVSASATSGLNVIFTSSDESVALCSGVNGSIITIIGAGTCDIFANQPGNLLYDVAPQVAQQLIVNPKEITVYADAKTKTFGDADPEFTYSYTPQLIIGDSFSGSLTRVAGENANFTYEILQSNLSAGDNYTITYISENLTILPRPITITVNPGQNKIYSQANPAVYTYILSSGTLIGADSFSGALTRELGENVGIYPILIGTLSLNANYQLSFIADNFEITEKAIIVTANPGQSKVYGLPDLTFSYTLSEFPLSGNTFTGALGRETGEDVGYYPINIGTLSLGINYSIIFVSNDFEITKKQLNVNVYPDQYKQYGETDPELFYWINGALVTGDSFSGTLGREPGEAPGFYEINIGSLCAGSNYNLTIIPQDFEITIMSIVVIADQDQTKIYGNSDPVFSYSYYGTLTNGDSFIGNLNRTAGENIGNYQINQGTLALNSNYTLNFISNSFEIIQRPITVVADAGQSKIYGQENPLVYSYSITEGSLVGTDSFTGAINRNSGEEAGLYTIHQGNLNLNFNYTITYVSNNFEIFATPITVIANANQSKTYGDNDPVFTYTTNITPVYGNYFSGTLSREEGENTGNYQINLGNLSLGTNYLINFVAADFEILTKDIIVTADDSQNKEFGEADPTFTYTTNISIAPWDSFTGDLNREFGENAGFYEIYQGTLAVNSNYNLIYVSADFEITKATPEIIWENPADMYNNVALSEIQLNATANNDGSFAYNPDFGTFMEVGDNQPLSTIFTPADAINYFSVEKTVYINVLLGVSVEENMHSEISVYPNPTNGIINFDFADNTVKYVTITDITGKTISLKSDIQANESIDLSMNPAGVYFAIIQTNDKIITIKIVLQ